MPEDDAIEASAPENPFGDGGRQLAVTSPVNFGRLHGELDAALPGKDVHAALRHPAREGEISAQNPAFLSWMPADLSVATVKRIIKGHDPTLPVSPDPASQIRGAGLAEQLRSLREQLTAGLPLSNEELASGLALLVQAMLPSSP